MASMDSRTSAATTSEEPLAPTQRHVVLETSGARPLPALHTAAYRGDVMSIMSCLTSGDNVNETVSVRNHTDKIVCGITPLFLAAQRGRTKVCKLLIENGANPNQPSYIENTTELCTPAEVATLNLHFILARYLKKAVSYRKEEDAVLESDDDVVSRRSSRGSRASIALNPFMLQPPPPQPAAAAATFMDNVGDLSNWDPNDGGALQEKKAKKSGFGLLSWRSTSTSKGPLSWMVGMGGSNTVSRSQAVDMPAIEPDTNSKVLNKFLKELDLAAWEPLEHEHEPNTPSSPCRSEADRHQVAVTAASSSSPAEITTGH